MGRPRTQLTERNVIGVDYELLGVPMDEILFDEDFNCRGAFTYESVRQLSESIEEHDLQVPIILWYRGDLEDGKKYQVAAGHRRYKACELLNYEIIPAIVRYDLDERRAQIINLTENISRDDLNVMEEAWALKKLYPEHVPLRKMQEELNQSTRWIHLRLRILELPEKVQSRLASGTMPLSYVESLWRIHRDKGQKACLQAFTEIEKAQNASGKVVKKKLPQWLRGKFPSTPSRKQIMELIVRMMEVGTIGLAPRVGAYCAGYISKEEVIEDIKKHSSQVKLAELEERIQQLEAEMY